MEPLAAAHLPTAAPENGQQAHRFAIGAASLLRTHFSALYRADRPVRIGRRALVKRAVRGARLGPLRRPRHKVGAGQEAPRGKVAGSEGRLARWSSRHARRSRQRGGVARAPGARRVGRAPRSWSVRLTLPLAYAVFLAAAGSILVRCSPIGSTERPGGPQPARRRDPGRRQRTPSPCYSTPTALRCSPTRSRRASLLGSSTLREPYGIYTPRRGLTPRT